MKYLVNIFLFLFVLSCQEVEKIQKKSQYDDHDVTNDFTLRGRKWDKTNLTYYIETGNSVMNSQTARQAFDIWQQNTKLTFIEVSQKDKADIKLSFASSNHGDGRNFDGKGGTLAHGFFPPPTTNAGTIHFDNEEQWTVNIKNNIEEPIDWITVAAHEIGHALGLDHSNNPNALMFPSYAGSHRYLDKDDQQGICAIYGCNSVTPPTSTISIIDGNITTISVNTNWTNDKKYLLKGVVRVKAGVTLTIEAGTIILGDKQTIGTLVIERGAKINAEGTILKPIVFTSAQPKGSRNYGDWGGIILLGNAPTNKSSNTNIEGVDNAPYGGNDINDNSGILKYIRIEFAGVAITPNNEINGLTLGGVGAGTTIEYVQVSYSGDDSFEWFGGTVNAKYLIAHRGWDDDFDTDYGFSGNVQFGLGIRDPQIADQSNSNGFESDNDNPASELMPRTSANFSNMTIIGALDRGVANIAPQFGCAAHLRRNTRQSIFNSILTGYPVGIHVDGTTTQADAVAGLLTVENTTLAANGKNLAILSLTSVATIVDDAPQTILDWWNIAVKNNKTQTSLQAIGISSINMASPMTTLMPAANSNLLTLGSFTNARLQSAIFEKVTFVGAFGNTNWIVGWTNFDPQNTDY